MAKKPTKAKSRGKASKERASRTNKHPKQAATAAPDTSSLIRIITVAVAFVGVVILNGLAVLQPLAGRDTGEISDMFPLTITPAGYAFSIWSLIYVLLLGYVIYQALPAQWHNPTLKRIAWPFVASCVFNMAWIVAWHNLFISLSIVLMVGLLLSLIVIHQRLHTAHPNAPQMALANDAGQQPAWFVSILTRLPFSVYLGWITVATVVNVGVVCWHWGWHSGGVFWGIVALLAATAINMLVLVRRRDYAVPAVAIWAFFAINIRRASHTPPAGLETDAVGLTALFCALCLLAVMLFLQDIPQHSELPEQYPPAPAA